MNLYLTGGADVVKWRDWMELDPKRVVKQQLEKTPLVATRRERNVNERDSKELIFGAWAITNFGLNKSLGPR